MHKFMGVFPFSTLEWQKDGAGHKIILAIADKKYTGSSGIWTRDLSHPKRESYP